MRRALTLVLALLLAACGSAPRRDLDYDRLHASLEGLAADPELARLALAERALAEAAVRRLDASSINADEHVQLSYLAERRVDIAYIAAQTERERVRLDELQREHASLLLAASRRETAAVRIELDRQRQRELLQQEDAQRGTITDPPPGVAVVPSLASPSVPATPVAPPPAAAAAPQASAPANPAPMAEGERRSAPAPVVAAPPPVVAPVATTSPDGSVASTLAQRLAALVPEYVTDGREMTLEDLIFEPGTATFAADATIGIARVAAWLAAEPTLGIRIAGHTDATGSPEANRGLSLRRAEAVRDALVERGIALSRITVSGEGAAVPVASNDDAAGRARNRRVVVRLGGGSG